MLGGALLCSITIVEKAHTEIFLSQLALRVGIWLKQLLQTVSNVSHVHYYV